MTQLVSPYLLLSLSMYLLQVRPTFMKCRPGFAVPEQCPWVKVNTLNLPTGMLWTGTISQAQPMTLTLKHFRHTCHLNSFRLRFSPLTPGLIKCSHQLSFREGLPGAGTRWGHFPMFSCHTQHSFSPALSTTVTEH